MTGRNGGTEKAGDDEKSMEAEMSLSISSWESKRMDRLPLLVVLLFVVVAAVVAVVVVLVAVVLVVLLLLLLNLLSTSKARDIFVA